MASGLLVSQMMFSGNNEDPYAAEDFISRYNAFASAVKYDERGKLANVGMFFTGTFKDWFKTHTFNDWDSFCEELKTFHNRRFSPETADTALQKRKKLSNETFDTYFYDVMRLLKQAQITDNLKHVRWLTKGLSPAMATQLAARKPTTPAAVLAIFHEWEELQNLMGIENLYVSSSTATYTPQYHSQEEEIRKLRQQLRLRDQVINALQAQSGPYQYRGRPPNSRSHSPYRQVGFGYDDDLSITRYFDHDEQFQRSVSASSIGPSDYNPNEWPYEPTVVAATTSLGQVPHLHIYVQGIPLVAMLDTGASSTAPTQSSPVPSATTTTATKPTPVDSQTKQERVNAWLTNIPANSHTERVAIQVGYLCGDNQAFPDLPRRPPAGRGRSSLDKRLTSMCNEGLLPSSGTNIPARTTDREHKKRPPSQHRQPPPPKKIRPTSIPARPAQPDGVPGTSTHPPQNSSGISTGLLGLQLTHD